MITDNVLVIVSAVLLITFFLERALELAKNSFDYYTAKNKDYEKWNAGAKEAAANIASKIDNKFGESFNSEQDRINVRDSQLISRDKMNPKILIINASDVRKLQLARYIRLISIFLGIMIMILLDLNLFYVISEISPTSETHPPLLFNTLLRGELGIWLSGVVIGLATDPLHRLAVKINKQFSKTP